MATKRSISRVTIAGHRLPSAEAEVLRVLLAADRPLLVAEVRDRLSGRRRAHTTVVTLLGRLVERGLAQRQGDARGHRYRPVGTQEELAIAALKDVIERLDDPAAALVAFINQMPSRARTSVKRALENPERPAR